MKETNKDLLFFIETTIMEFKDKLYMYEGETDNIIDSWLIIRKLEKLKNFLQTGFKIEGLTHEEKYCGLKN